MFVNAEFDRILVTHENSNLTSKLFEYNIASSILSIEFNCEDDEVQLKIDKILLKNFKAIATFSLNGCIRYNFPESAFLNHSTLSSVTVTNCAITKINKKTFAELSNLQKLDLSNNKIKSINGKIFAKNVNLKKLTINNVTLNSIMKDVFSDLQNFTTLEMNFNKHFDFPINEPFLESKSLEQYSCSDCGITQMTSITLSKLSDLKELNLNNNKLLSLAGANIFPKNLNILILDRNNFKKLNNETFYDLSNLHRLQVDGNPFEPCRENNKFMEFYTERNFRANVINTNLEPFENNLIEYNDFSTVITIPNQNDTSSPAHNETISGNNSITLNDSSTVVTTPNQTDNSSSNHTKNTIVNHTPNQYNNFSSSSTDIPTRTEPIAEGISNAFIASYLSLMSAIQAGIIILLLFWILKLVRSKETDIIDISMCVSNPNEMYKIR